MIINSKKRGKIKITKNSRSKKNNNKFSIYLSAKEIKYLWSTRINREGGMEISSKNQMSKDSFLPTTSKLELSLRLPRPNLHQKSNKMTKLVIIQTKESIG